MVSVFRTITVALFFTFAFNSVVSVFRTVTVALFFTFAFDSAVYVSLVTLSFPSCNTFTLGLFHSLRPFGFGLTAFGAFCLLATLPIGRYKFNGALVDPTSGRIDAEP